MENQNDQVSRLEMIGQLVKEYREALPPDQPAWREVIAKVYAQALRDTDQVSDIALKEEFAELRNIASSGDFETNAAAVASSIVQPMMDSAKNTTDAVKNRLPNPALEMPLSMSANFVDLVENPGRNLERTQQAAAVVGGMLNNAWQFGASKLGFPTDEERNRLAEIYELPYEERLKKLHTETLHDTGTMVSIGSAPGMFAGKINAARATLGSAAQTTFSDLGRLTAQAGDLKPALVTGPVEVASQHMPAVMASKAAAVLPAVQSSSAPIMINGEQSLGTLSLAGKSALNQVNLTPIRLEIGNGLEHQIEVRLHIRPEQMVDAATGNRLVVTAQMKGNDGNLIKPVTFLCNLHQDETQLYKMLSDSGKINSSETPFFITGNRHSVEKIQDRLTGELEILAKNARFYGGGDTLQPRADYAVKAASPNIKQQALHTLRYGEVSAALNQFLEIAERYRMPVDEKAQTAAVTTAGVASQASEKMHRMDGLGDTGQDAFTRRIIENAAKQQPASDYGADR